MIVIYCCNLILEAEISGAEMAIAIGTIALAISTIALALFTFFLYREAKKQLIKATEFVKKYTNASEINSINNQVQSVENIILKQIDFHYRIIDGIKRSLSNEKDVFLFLYEKRLKRVYSLDTGIYSDGKRGVVEKINTAYRQLFKNYGYLLGHYYRNLYRIFKKIDETVIPGFDKDHYAKLVRSQLSEFEILLLFYNCIWVEDSDKFKDLVERYKLLEGINYKKLLETDVHLKSKLYMDQAFGEDWS